MADFNEFIVCNHVGKLKNVPCIFFRNEFSMMEFYIVDGEIQADIILTGGDKTKTIRIENILWFSVLSGALDEVQIRLVAGP